MATLFKEANYNLATLIQNIDLGTIGLPDIQRPFVWPDTKVRELFDSMYKGYPVGYLLFWENANMDGTKGIGTLSKQKVPNLLIVDGQQRLTSLYAVVRGMEIVRENYRKELIQIAFRPLEEKFEVLDIAIRRSPEWINNISELWRPETDLYDFITDFIDNLQQHRDLAPEERKKIQKAITKLKNLEHYPFSALELSAAINEEQVADVFVRINSQGKTLNQADFILTLMSVFWDEGRKQLEEFCRLCRLPSKTTASPFNYIIEPDPDQMLRISVGFGFKRARLQFVYSILRGKDLETGEFSTDRRDQQFEKLKQAQEKALDITYWHEFLKALKQAGYNRGELITSQTNILYCYVMFLIGRIEYGIDNYTLRNLISRWFFVVSLTGRYTNSPESAMEFDLASFRGALTGEQFIKVLEEVIDAALTNDFWHTNVPNSMAKASPRNPTLYAYYAALNILDARGLFSKLRVRELLEEGLKSKKSALERHHLFPKAYLKRLGIVEQQQTNQIANYALVEWNDNIAISDDAPADYLPKYLQRLSDTEKEQMYYWHGLPENWEQMDYALFLIDRRRRIAQVIKDAYAKINQKAEAAV